MKIIHVFTGPVREIVHNMKMLIISLAPLWKAVLSGGSDLGLLTMPLSCNRSINFIALIRLAGHLPSHLYYEIIILNVFFKGEVANLKHLS